MSNFHLLFQFVPDGADFAVLELIACHVGNEPGTDGYDGLMHRQIVLFQGRARLHDIHNHMAQPQNGSQFNGAVQVDDVDVPALGSVVVPGNVGKFGGNLQGFPHRIPEILFPRHRHPAHAHAEVEKLVNVRLIFQPFGIGHFPK